MGAFGANFGANFAGFAVSSALPPTPPTKTVTTDLCVTTSIKADLCV